MTVPAPIEALRPAQKQLATAFLSWMNTLEQTRAQLREEAIAEGHDPDEQAIEAERRTIVAAARVQMPTRNAARPVRLAVHQPPRSPQCHRG